MFSCGTLATTGIPNPEFFISWSRRPQTQVYSRNKNNNNNKKQQQQQQTAFHCTTQLRHCHLKALCLITIQCHTKCQQSRVGEKKLLKSCDETTPHGNANQTDIHHRFNGNVGGHFWETRVERLWAFLSIRILSRPWAELIFINIICRSEVTGIVLRPYLTVTPLIYRIIWGRGEEQKEEWFLAF